MTGAAAAVVADSEFEWTRSDTLCLSDPHCTRCFGLGLRHGRGGTLVPCGCVLRKIFRACYARFQHLETCDKHLSQISYSHFNVFTTTGPRMSGPGRKHEEYCADFWLVAKRSLRKAEWDVFRFHFLLGGDWKVCCRRLNISRGDFFHLVYTVQERLGRTFRELRPYSLFPLDEYFSCTRYTRR